MKYLLDTDILIDVLRGNPPGKDLYQVGLTQLPIAFLLELEVVVHESPYSTA